MPPVAAIFHDNQKIIPSYLVGSQIISNFEPTPQNTKKIIATKTQGHKESQSGIALNEKLFKLRVSWSLSVFVAKL